MRIFLKITLIILAFFNSFGHADEYKYILNEKELNEIYIPAYEQFKDSDIEVIKFPQGIILRIFINDICEEYCQISPEIFIKINNIKNFLANFQNPVIIEVHAERTFSAKFSFIKKWEITTVIANNIEKIVSNMNKNSKRNINSVGYGEFMPMKNTPNNGGKSSDRIDIIILCNISGE
ncbi:hypothetical protein IJO12_07355 [bacterium]|nr:hypothetical protein [bacterium]